MKISVILADDHRIFREGVRTLLEIEDEIHVAGEAEDGREVLRLARRLRPHAVVMDVSMPGLNGIEATRKLVAERPEIKVIALSMQAHRGLVREMLVAGATAYLLKECAFEELVRAIRLAVKQDQMYLSPEISRQVVAGFLRSDGTGGAPDQPRLTPAEREILQLVAEGHTSRKIATLVSMSPRTVEKHRLMLMRKLGLRSVAEVVKYAIREGLSLP